MPNLMNYRELTFKVRPLTLDLFDYLATIIHKSKIEEWRPTKNKKESRQISIELLDGVNISIKREDAKQIDIPNAMADAWLPGFIVFCIGIYAQPIAANILATYIYDLIKQLVGKVAPRPDLMKTYINFETDISDNIDCILERLSVVMGRRRTLSELLESYPDFEYYINELTCFDCEIKAFENYLYKLIFIYSTIVNTTIATAEAAEAKRAAKAAIEAVNAASKAIESAAEVYYIAKNSGVDMKNIVDGAKADEKRAIQAAQKAVVEATRKNANAKNVAARAVKFAENAEEAAKKAADAAAKAAEIVSK